MRTHACDVLFVSNGHGEDAVATRIIDALRENPAGGALRLSGWPMVGAGAAYRQRAVPVIEASNLLPSEGFATLSWRLMARDLAAGWIGTHWRQFRAARALRGRQRLIVAVGDIVPISAAVQARTQFMFVGCAKSSYYRAHHGYTPLEKRLLRRHCACTFPRDPPTVTELTEAGVPVRYVGNPMMDGLEGTDAPLGVPNNARIVAILPGSRSDRVRNLCRLLSIAAAVWEHMHPAAPLAFVAAVSEPLDVRAVLEGLAREPCAALWQHDGSAAAHAVPRRSMRLVGPGGVEAHLLVGRFADVLRAATLAIGMGGTANEQAVGLGVPLVAVPSDGPQGEAYVRMKASFFGDCAVTAPREPTAAARIVAALLNDPARRDRMARIGRERMGEAGASHAIAAEILRRVTPQAGARG